ncbi:hypothetical protein E4U17_001402 [Claviceps sp. LM77 group G4]|nr:hypothetical protein E4U17_001402 [Claviceps sp. LM77 group G4]KAG6078705.1 hypothetical protein E4U16_001507 [Claviceps sp. LM84 group G4]KAG6079445.1 hypothetical protein E4U33_000185 [Claviceps sp. LM78 group G4]
MSVPFPNLYAHRKVAETAAKACDICFKPSTSVLITADKKDYFYVCPTHLKDAYFCTPKTDEAAIKAKKEKALAEEIEKVKKEYQEKQQKKKEKEEAKKNGEGDKSSAKDEDKGKDSKPDSKESDETNSKSSVVEDTPMTQEEPRIFELKSTFYEQRLRRRRQAEAAKRDKERAAQVGNFPSVPSEPPTR